MKARILVIEDEPAINNLLCMNLEVTGYQTVSYLDGNDASEGIAWDHEFQCALVDIMLPGKDGYTLLPELNHYGIPVIFLTARADIASKVKGLKEGAEDYIVKPFEMLEVMVRLEKVLERHGNLQEQIQINNMYSIRITVNSIRNDGTTRKDPGNGGKPRKIKGFSELMKRGGTRIDTFFEKRAHFSEQKEKLSTLSTKRAGKPHKQRVPGSF